MAEKSVKKTLTTLVIIVVVLALTGGAMLGINAAKKKKSQGFGGMPGGPGGWGGHGFGGGVVTSVKTVTAIPETMHDFVNTNGNIETQRSIEVYPTISGKVVQVNVSLGSQVKAGDVIAYVDPSAAGVNYKWSPVVAPISGSIISSPVKTGQTISSNTVVAKIGDIENLQISASVPERYVGALKPGLKAEVVLQAYDDVVFTATVVRVSPILDAASRTKSVILNFDKQDSRINAGMFAKVKLYTVDYPNSISIAQDAIVTVNTDSFLYVVKDDETVEKRLVKLGKNVNGYYQITSGIKPGEKVVTAGMLTLTDGAKVKDITNGVPASEKKPPVEGAPKTEKDSANGDKGKRK